MHMLPLLWQATPFATLLSSQPNAYTMETSKTISFIWKHDVLPRQPNAYTMETSKTISFIWKHDVLPRQPNAYTMETIKTISFIWKHDVLPRQTILHLHLKHAKVHSMSVSFPQVPSIKLKQRTEFMRGGGSNVCRIEYQPNTTGHDYGTYHN
jgi:molybdopterin synthase catalytic subunit